MKKIYLPLIIALFFGTYGFAQEEEMVIEYPANEFKVNMLYILAEVPEFTYERLLAEDAAIGLSLGFAIDEDIDYEFGLIPYYRFYFGKGYAQGFFLEANTFFGTVRDYYYDFNEVTGTADEGYDSQFTFGVGIAAGAKFLTSKEWIGEIYLGLGRYFNDFDDYNFGYPRIGIVFGKRW